MKRSLFPILALLAVFISPALAQAPQAAPLHLSVTKALTPVTDVLTSLSQQSGVPILADDTVVDTLGVTTIDKPTLPEMLDAISSLVPAVKWQRIEIPSDAPIPDANVLSAQVRDLQALVPSQLTVTNPATRTAVFFMRHEVDPSKTSNLPGRTVYLLTNETVRAQRLAIKKAAEEKKQADAPLNRYLGGFQTFAKDFSQLTLEEQRQVLPIMMTEMKQIMRTTDPSVMEDLQQAAAENNRVMVTQ